MTRRRRTGAKAERGGDGSLRHWPSQANHGPTVQIADEGTMRSVAAIASLLLRQACCIAFVAATALPQEATERPDPLARWLPLLEAARAEIQASERTWFDDELFEIDLARGAPDRARARLPARLAKSHSAQVLQLLQTHLQRGELPQARRLLSHTHGMDQSAALWDIGLAEARRGASSPEQTLQRQPEAQRKPLRALARAHGNEPAPLGEVRQALLALPASDERDLCISVLIDLAPEAALQQFRPWPESRTRRTACRCP